MKSRDGPIKGWSQAFKREYDLIWELVRIAEERDIPVKEPFAGQQIGPFTVLSSTREAYMLLMPQFDKTPEADQAAIEALATG